MAKKSEFPHKQYQKLAHIIHKRFCEEPQFCTYDKGADGYHCQAAADAEHIAAGIIIRHGKVKVRKMIMDDEG